MLEYENIFKGIDINKDGVIDRDEILKSKYRYLFLAMHSLGYRSMSIEDVEKMIAEVDLNKNNLIEFSEFLQVFWI